MMPSSEKWTRRTLYSLAIAAALGTLAVPARAEPCPEDSDKAVRVDITLDQEAATVSVDPDVVEIYLEPGPDRPARVCWVVTGLAEGQTVHIQGKPDAEDLFPSLERDIQYPRDFANSGKPARVGTWPYEVSVTDADDQEVMRIDPSVDIGGY